LQVCSQVKTVSKSKLFTSSTVCGHSFQAFLLSNWEISLCE
jgi:hypothetical protein